MATAQRAAPVRRRLRAPRFLLAIPAWCWYLGFFVVPLVFIIVYSFGYKPDVVTATSSIGLDRLSLDNYRTAFDETFRLTFRNTLRVALLGTFLCLVIAFPFAYFLATKVSSRWRGVLLGLVIIPFWTSFLIRTLAWTIILSPSGLVSTTLQDWGLRDTPLQFLATRGAVQLGVVYNYLPLMIFPLFVALDRLDPALREASKDLGAGRVRTFLQVTLPLASPGIVAGTLLVFIPLAGDYITAQVLGGAKGTMVGSLVASQFLEKQDWALGSAMAVVLILAIVATIVAATLVVLVLRGVLRTRRSVDVAGLAGAPA